MFFIMTEQHKIELNNWQSFVTENYFGAKTRDALIKYIERLIERSSIVILDIKHLASIIGIEEKVLASMIAYPPSFYYSFCIPKRKGGFRNIAAPYPALLHVQRWIYENLLKQIELNPSATGFRKDKTIISNATEHLNAKCVLKMDIKDFFPSILKNRIIAVFRIMGYTKKMSYNLASLCCLDNCLPQGAATSPCLSNIIAKRMDFRLHGLAEKFDLKYTRYADDFTFSGEFINHRHIDYITNIVEKEGFRINDKKTQLIGKNGRKIITGISISSGKLTIPKLTKRVIRKNVYFVLKYGLMKHLENIGEHDPIYLERLLGILYFWKSVEPNKEYIHKAINEVKRYSKQLDEELKEYKYEDFEFVEVE